MSIVLLKASTVVADECTCKWQIQGKYFPSLLIIHPKVTVIIHPKVTVIITDLNTNCIMH